MVFSDASFASSSKSHSYAGNIIVCTHANIVKNHERPISPISLGSKKIQRVVTSTLSAETASLATALDQLSWVRLYWKWLHDPSTKWHKPDDALCKVEPEISVNTIPSEMDLAVTDCKSLYDLISRTAPPACSEFRVQLVARYIKENLRENINLRWVHTGAQLADALTKAMEARFLRETLKHGFYKLHDESATLKERAKTEIEYNGWKVLNEVWSTKEFLGVWFSNLTTSSFLQVDQTVVLKALGLEASQWRVGLRKCFLSHSCVVTGSPFIQGSGNPTWPLWHCRQPCHSLSLAFALTSNLGTSCGICEKGSAAFFREISWFWGNRLDIGSWHPFPSSSGSQTPSVLPIIIYIYIYTWDFINNLINCGSTLNGNGSKNHRQLEKNIMFTIFAYFSFQVHPFFWCFAERSDRWFSEWRFLWGWVKTDLLESWNQHP